MGDFGVSIDNVVSEAISQITPGAASAITTGANCNLRTISRIVREIVREYGLFREYGRLLTLTHIIRTGYSHITASQTASRGRFSH